MRLQRKWISRPFIGVYYTISPTGNNPPNTHTISCLPHNMSDQSLIPTSTPRAHSPSHTHSSHTLLFAYPFLTHTHNCRIACWIPLISWNPLIYISLPHTLMNNFHIWGRRQDIPPSPDRSNMPVLQIYTHPSSFKYSLENTHISLITIVWSWTKCRRQAMGHVLASGHQQP